MGSSWASETVDFAGSISYAQMATAVARGYAAAGTDTGHKTGPGIDASWALNHPEKIKDFGYRAIHETAVAGKTLTATFYGTAAKRAYFNSCSNGGRQALMEAQRFPEDYDGIIAGAPANYWTRLLSMAIVNSQATLADAASYFPASKLPAISSAALAACDANDDVKDGVIENPPACRFDPAVLLCKGSENDSCLTPPQLTALRKIYDVTRTSTGQTIMPGYSLGGESEAGGWTGWITGPAPEKSAMYSFGTQFFSYMVFANPAWDFRTFNLDRDWKAASDKVGRDLDADSADLRAISRTRWQAHSVSRMERRGDPRPAHHRLLQRDRVDDGIERRRKLHSAIHGPRDAALWRRQRCHGVWPASPRRRRRPGTQHQRRPREVGRAGERTRADRRLEDCRRERCRDAAPLPVPADGAL